MWNSDDPKSKWLHLVVKLVAAVIIFKLGVLVGEFKIIKTMVVGGSAHPKMLFRGGDDKAGERFFNKRIMPLVGDDDRVMMWKGDKAQDLTSGEPVPPPAPGQ